MGTNNKKSPDYLCKVPNDERGAFFLYQLQTYINPGYCVKVRGSSPDHKALKKAGEKSSHYRHGIPVKFAKELRVYMCDKTNGKRGRVVGLSDLKTIERYQALWAESDSAARVATIRFNDILARMKDAAEKLNNGLKLYEVKYEVKQDGGL